MTLQQSGRGESHPLVSSPFSDVVQHLSNTTLSVLTMITPMARCLGDEHRQRLKARWLGFAE